jgi:hypothetical protein
MELARFEAHSPATVHLQRAGLLSAFDESATREMMMTMMRAGSCWDSVASLVWYILVIMYVIVVVVNRKRSSENKKQWCTTKSIYI